MITMNRIVARFGRIFESIAKARVNSVLLGMGREKVEEFGYSYELLRMGPSAWPWREMPQDSASKTDTSPKLIDLQAHKSDLLPQHGVGCGTNEHQEQTAA